VSHMWCFMVQKLFTSNVLRKLGKFGVIPENAIKLLQ
jgi:hypothetical protein